MFLAWLLDRLPVLLSYHGMSQLKKQGTPPKHNGVPTGVPSGPRTYGWLRL